MTSGSRFLQRWCGSVGCALAFGLASPSAFASCALIDSPFAELSGNAFSDGQVFLVQVEEDLPGLVRPEADRDPMVNSLAGVTLIEVDANGRSYELVHTGDAPSDVALVPFDNPNAPNPRAVLLPIVVSHYPLLGPLNSTEHLSDGDLRAARMEGISLRTIDESDKFTISSRGGLPAASLRSVDDVVTNRATTFGNDDLRSYSAPRLLGRDRTHRPERQYLIERTSLVEMDWRDGVPRNKELPEDLYPCTLHVLLHRQLHQEDDLSVLPADRIGDFALATHNRPIEPTIPATGASVEGNRELVLFAQQLVNELSAETKVKQDGIWGTRTENAIKRVLGAIGNSYKPPLTLNDIRRLEDAKDLLAERRPQQFPTRTSSKPTETSPRDLNLRKTRLIGMALRRSDRLLQMFLEDSGLVPEFEPLVQTSLQPSSSSNVEMPETTRDGMERLRAILNDNIVDTLTGLREQPNRIDAMLDEIRRDGLTLGDDRRAKPSVAFIQYILDAALPDDEITVDGIPGNNTQSAYVKFLTLPQVSRAVAEQKVPELKPANWTWQHGAQLYRLIDPDAVHSRLITVRLVPTTVDKKPFSLITQPSGLLRGLETRNGSESLGLSDFAEPIVGSSTTVRLPTSGRLAGLCFSGEGALRPLREPFIAEDYADFCAPLIMSSGIDEIELPVSLLRENVSVRVIDAETQGTTDVKVAFRGYPGQFGNNQLISVPRAIDQLEVIKVGASDTYKLASIDGTGRGFRIRWQDAQPTVTVKLDRKDVQRDIILSDCYGNPLQVPEVRVAFGQAVPNQAEVFRRLQGGSGRYRGAIPAPGTDLLTFVAETEATAPWSPDLSVAGTGPSSSVRLPPKTADKLFTVIPRYSIGGEDQPFPGSEVTVQVSYFNYERTRQPPCGKVKTSSLSLAVQRRSSRQASFSFPGKTAGTPFDMILKGVLPTPFGNRLLVKRIDAIAETEVETEVQLEYVDPLFHGVMVIGDNTFKELEAMGGSEFQSPVATFTNLAQPFQLISQKYGDWWAHSFLDVGRAVTGARDGYSEIRCGGDRSPIDWDNGALLSCITNQPITDGLAISTEQLLKIAEEGARTAGISETDAPVRAVVAVAAFGNWPRTRRELQRLSDALAERRTKLFFVTFSSWVGATRDLRTTKFESDNLVVVEIDPASAGDQAIPIFAEAMQTSVQRFLEAR